MDYIERPKKVTKAESSIQDNNQMQKNMQTQLNNIYEYLDKLIDSIKEMERTQLDVIQKIGLGDTVPIITNQELNDIEISGFVYLNTCTLNGTFINNGYLLTLIASQTYRVQFYIDAYENGVLQYRKCVNKTWSNFTNV